ncbi:MAG: DEAD/DEAH box helicase family protein [Leptospiraceae bacterium]|nr:DEAD/DEAH box helicase family protein [Leptospiraceae bacterium]
MDRLNQLTLDFETTREEESKKYIYLSNKKDLGVGKIIHEDEEFYTISFISSRNVLQVKKSNFHLRFLDFSLEALENQEQNKNLMNLALSAVELKLTHTYDKLSSLSNSRTRLLPHQIESTFVVANSLKPRFILADEVGLGKTIEAALIMKELIFRKGYKKVLVIAPSPLLVQWKQELKNKFNEEFTIIKRKNFVTGQENNHNWQNFDHVITSIDFIKNPKYAEEVLKKKWDIVVFDEAHRLRRDYSKVTRSYLFAEKISKKCECLLLLTATPFRGKLEELFYLMHLVDPNILGPYHTFVNDYIIGCKTDLKEKISKVLLRRRKVEIGGFTKRFAKTVMIELSGIERQFYNETTEYVRREYNLAMRSKNKAIGFVMVVFQKLLDSSVFALLNALTKRKFMLETKLHRFSGKPISLDDWDPDETEDIEEFIGELDEAAWQDLTNLRRELLTLNRLIMMGRQIKEDKKSIKLKETLLKLRKEGNPKFIIFTQFRTTQDYLYNILSDEFSVSLFHGSLNMDQKEEAIQDFKTKTEILICTEAGGEGRNLQFANFLFNYDLPWSPLKIEQRIGRIHRFGQKKNVYIFNFASKDTVAERILEVLTNKIRLFEESIGTSDALLGTIEEEFDFNSTLMKFVTGSKTKEEMDQELDLRVKVAEQGFQKLNNLVTPKLLDFNLQDYYNHTLSERQFDNSHLEDFVLNHDRYFPEVSGVEIEPAENKIYRIRLGSDWKLATFDSELALQNDSLEFLAFGHPIVENAINHFLDKKLGYNYKIINSLDFRNKACFVFLVDFQFGMSRKEIYYYEYNFFTGKASRLSGLPYSIKFYSDAENSEEDDLPLQLVETALLEIYERVEIDSEIQKEELARQTKGLFKKEEYKIELTNEKTLRQLKEKLDRQEAQSLWEGKPERKSVINRTKNEIIKAREEFDRELRKIRSGSKIVKSIELFQVYLGEIK